MQISFTVMYFSAKYIKMHPMIIDVGSTMNMIVFIAVNHFLLSPQTLQANQLLI